jgi:FHA domain
MPTYPCPNGHESTESDFCSACGAKILDSVQPVQAASRPVSALPMQTCPDCSAPHESNSGDFCEICGYNFVTGAHGELAIEIPASTQTGASTPKPADQPPPSSAPAIAVSQPISAPSSWQLVISLDATPHHADSPPTPSHTPITLTLEKPVNLIGRTSQARANYPEIAIDFDDAISHRHAVLTVQGDRTLILRDIGSSNGTQLNGVDLTALVDTPIHPGDEITLGHWTRIKVSEGNP